MQRFFENCCNANTIPDEAEEHIQQPMCANACSYGDYVLICGSRVLCCNNNVNPMLDEICRFMKQDDSIETDTPNCARSQKFSKCIQIAELKDMIATVTSVGDGGKVNVQAHANETVMNLQFEPDDLLKVFKANLPIVLLLKRGNFVAKANTLVTFLKLMLTTPFVPLPQASTELLPCLSDT
ncbi:hypothetical protein Pelo_8993 [Pelomyxa schiedti]|nr:hypothetical protein Pelo_8993 [Pelomyxa schiedti]